MPCRHRLLCAMSLTFALTACGGGADDAADAPITEPTQVSVTEGFATPESVLWDAEQQVWFVSNINGGPTDRDDNGFISRLTADGTIDSLHWVSGGRGGVTLNAPKGMAIVGDLLWVTDIDALRAFDRRSGALMASMEFGDQAKFLNDITADPDGALYITDTGIAIGPEGMTRPGPDRIFKVVDGMMEVIAEGAHLEAPNGIAWDAANNRLIMVPFASAALYTLSPDGRAGSLGTGLGGHDGVEILADGRIIVSSWEGGSVFAVGVDNAENTVLISGLDAPADIGLDRARNVVAIPLFNQNRVEFWRIP
ncbi:MAG TPA: SMP-30/gluconolactonase/LRE family protein [Gemmatimonadales bacterium]|nr:SMP-30/gluconolactonase/LRE family protein [Gemmatimonadales bacterium]